MTVIVDFQLATDDAVPEPKFFERWAAAALFELQEDAELSIRIVTESESAELNEQFRNKQGPTNVLSFPFESPIDIEPRLLGDLVICAEVVKREAMEQGKQEINHWAHMVIHGCLHLLGYDHVETEQAEEMEALEITILQQLDVANPYLEQGVEE